MSENPPFPWDENTNMISLPSDIEREIAELASVGDQVRAIRKVMELTGAGLKVSKDYVDSLKERREESLDNRPMDSEETTAVQEILKALEFYDGTFPRKALEDAVHHREQIIPDLLRIIEQIKEKAEKSEVHPDYMAHLYAMFLLAQFRERRAYPLIVDFFQLPGERTYDLTGDVVTENLGQILASVSGGDTRLMTALAENEAADDYVRDAALGGLLVLVACEEKSRDEVMAYFKSLFRGKLDRKPSHVWGGLISCCTQLYPEEVMEDIKKVFEEDLVDLFYITLDDVEECLAAGKEKALYDLHNSRYGLIEDTIYEMEWWNCFQQKDVPVNKKNKPGRNDPCWCGSGKKYKKCHLDADRAASN